MNGYCVMLIRSPRKQGYRGPTPSQPGSSPVACSHRLRARTCASSKVMCDPCTLKMSTAAGSKNIWVVGGGDLAGQFFDAGLLDELIVQVGSVTLGKGKPLFPRRVAKPPLRLVSVRQVGTGFAELHYEVRGSDAAGAA